jgi:DNA-binding Lrp family transcriptional regulator
MDETDKQILAALSGNARLPVTTLARRLGLARSTVQARIERMERDGVIAGYALRLGAGLSGPALRASILVTIEPQTQGAVVARLKPMPEVIRVHTTSGRFDLLIEVAAPTTSDLDRVLDAIGALPGVRSSESLIQLTRKIDRRAAPL